MNSLRACVLFVCVFALVQFSYGSECPEDTVTKVIEKNSDKEDKKMLNIVTTCKNAQGKVLKKYESREENPFGPSVQVHSFQYKSVIKNTHTITNGNKNDNNDDDNIETFD